MTGNILNSFKNNLPQKPYCADELSFGLKIRPAETAIKKRYLQYNKPTDLRWFVYDVDRPTAHFDWNDCKASSEFREDACKEVAENINKLNTLHYLNKYIKSSTVNEYPALKTFYKDFIKTGDREFKNKTFDK